MPTTVDSPPRSTFPPTPPRPRQHRRGVRWAVVAVLLATVAVVAAVLPTTSTPAPPTSPSGGGSIGAPGAGGGPTSAGAGGLSQAEAANRLAGAGIAVSSTAGCDDRADPDCTALAGIRPATITMVLDLAAASGCALTLTGGTETGHAPGPYSHDTGYKVDLAKSTCLDQYVADHFPAIGVRADGYPQWRSPSGNLYADEISHWDVTALSQVDGS